MRYGNALTIQLRLPCWNARLLRVVIASSGVDEYARTAGYEKTSVHCRRPYCCGFTKCSCSARQRRSRYQDCYNGNRRGAPVPGQDGGRPELYFLRIRNSACRTFGPHGLKIGGQGDLKMGSSTYFTIFVFQEW